MHDQSEYTKCADSFIYFSETYLKIIHPAKGLIPFTLYDYQKRYADHIDGHRFTIAKKFRNGGFTTMTLAWLTWRLLFHPNENNVALYRSEREIFYYSDLVKNLIKWLPDFLIPKRGKWNDHTMENLNNGSCLRLFNINYFAETKVGLSKQKIDCLFLDEPAFFQKMERHWLNIFYMLNENGKVVAVSTPNGKEGWFYETYNRAANLENSFALFHSNYLEHPDYDNEEWIARMKTNLGERGFKQEVLAEFL